MQTAAGTAADRSQDLQEPSLVWVAPQKINLVFSPPRMGSPENRIALKRELQSEQTPIRPGEWDQPHAREFTELDVYVAMRHRFVEDGLWEDTSFYERIVGEMAKGTPKWGCRTPEEFKQRLNERIERLYRTIAKDGYRTQTELGAKDPRNEIRVGIRRDGRLLFIDGRHRLAIARLLGIREVPVRIVVRHSEWADVKSSILDYADAHRGRVYQLIDHPDLRQIPAQHGTDRIEIISRALADDAHRDLSLLDIGTHWGYMCQQLEAIGFRCTGVELNAASAAFARAIQVATESNFDVWRGSVFDYPNAEQHDVVLALNIFHHFTKTKALHEQLERFLARLTARTIIFEPHRHDPPGQMANAYRNYAAEEFVEFVGSGAGMSHAEEIGEAKDGRLLFKLTR